ncbi:MAG TPA: type I-C CRISPR-associated endonuclease Cas1c [Pseudoflavonifractor sp.]|nr:type I-C CRISPR-associated endonuclease Cas1c [Pseudoflavonifractor sp.]
MRHLLNTLFVLTEDAYLSLDGENVVISQGKREIGRFPLHTLENIASFSYAGASPSLMGACGERSINLCFFTPRGRFLARISGESQGNFLLRRTQYRMADSPWESVQVARNMIFGKVYNCRWSIERTRRDHGLRVDDENLSAALEYLAGQLPLIRSAEDLDSLRGLEGKCASTYFTALDEMILSNKTDFFFQGRSRRPPLDNVNALLSFAYSLLAHDCTGALSSVGLDPYVGFLHRDRPGRTSLALDLMEELRGIIADRFVLTLINNRVLDGGDFLQRENGGVLLTDGARKKFLSAWQEKKRQQITHPYLKEQLPWGLVPYVQALLLARFMRGDLDGYPPFLWK